MSRQYWVAPLPPLHTASGTAYTNSITATDISPAPNIVLPANLLEPGSELEIRAHGQITSTTGTVTITLGAYFGGVAGGASSFTCTPTVTASLTAAPWMLDVRCVVRANGSSGSVNGQGRLYLGTSLTALTMLAIPITAGARTITVDTTSAKALTIGATWGGTATAANSITCDDISVKLVT